MDSAGQKNRCTDAGNMYIVLVSVSRKILVVLLAKTYVGSTPDVATRSDTYSVCTI